MSWASCVLCAQLYLCAPALHLPYVCPCLPRTCLSASAWVCLSCFLCVAKRACLGHMSAVCLGVPCPRGCGHCAGRACVASL